MKSNQNLISAIFLALFLVLTCVCSQAQPQAVEPPPLKPQSTPSPAARAAATAQAEPATVAPHATQANLDAAVEKLEGEMNNLAKNFQAKPTTVKSSAKGKNFRTNYTALRNRILAGVTWEQVPQLKKEFGDLQTHYNNLDERVGVIETWRKDTVDPTLNDLKGRVGKIEQKIGKTGIVSLDDDATTKGNTDMVSTSTVLWIIAILAFGALCFWLATRRNAQQVLLLQQGQVGGNQQLAGGQLPATAQPVTYSYVVETPVQVIQPPPPPPQMVVGAPTIRRI